MGYTHLYFLCPYFKWDAKMAVGCEGKTVIRFPSKKLCRKHLGKYCAGDWQSCQYAQVMNEYYEEESNGNNDKGVKGKDK